MREKCLFIIQMGEESVIKTEEDFEESEAAPKVDPRLAVLSKLLNDTQDN